MKQILHRNGSPPDGIRGKVEHMHRQNSPEDDWEFDPDAEREVALDDDDELSAPATLDADESIEVDDDDLEAIAGDGPRD
ncbi:MAG: hypothetical protein JWR36_285 [Glaciihabitans sp.]|nr:hypothetical protein [Glaciihabitans sp.]